MRRYVKIHVKQKPTPSPISMPAMVHVETRRGVREAAARHAADERERDNADSARGGGRAGRDGDAHAPDPDALGRVR